MLTATRTARPEQRAKLTQAMPRQSAHNRPSPLLRLSLLLNLLGIGLLVALIWQLQSLYSDYRYHRTLVQGSSQASTAAPTQTDAKTIVLLGDSRISEWRPALQIEGYQIINAGVGGESTIEIQRRLERDVLRLKPDIVILQAGINDLTAASTRGMQDPEAFRRQVISNIGSIVDTLTAHGIRVVLTPIIPAQQLNLPRRVFWIGDLHASVSNANLLLRGVARDRGASWFDINQPVTNAKRQAIPSMYSDTLHLNQTAYKQLNQALTAHLNAMALL